MDSLREQIKELERRPPRKTDCPHSPYAKDGKHYDSFVRNPICGDCFADQILKFLKQQVEGLTVIGDEEIIKVVTNSYKPTFKGFLRYLFLGERRRVKGGYQELAKAQLQDCKDKLLGVME